MDYEVEIKFRIDDTSRLTTLLAGLGATSSDPVCQRDVYFNHPSRNFAETDEAFRIRSIGDDNRLTYKGPLVDRTTKTRQEVEVGCERGDSGREKLHCLLSSLGFREVGTVVKQRTQYHLTCQEWPVEVAIDDVDGLGMFVELETIAEASNWEAAREVLFVLAASIELEDSQRTSYLQLLLTRDK